MQPLNVLIVDDEVLIALDVVLTVEATGARVLGPAHDLKSGFALTRDELAGAAFLDIDVGGESVWPLARDLVRRGWDVTFVSADPSYPELKDEFAACRFLDKPASPDEIVAALTPLLLARQ